MDQIQPNPLHEAMRADLRRIIDSPSFDASVLKSLIRKAKAAQQYLMADALIDQGGEILGEGLGEGLPSLGSTALYPNPSINIGAALNSETFGAKVIREAFPMITEMERIKQQSPERMVDAIAAARESGQDELAQILEKRLLGNDYKMLERRESGDSSPTSIDAEVPLSISGTPLKYGLNVQPRNADQISDPAILSAVAEVSGKSLRQLAAELDYDD